MRVKSAGLNKINPTEVAASLTGYSDLINQPNNTDIARSDRQDAFYLSEEIEFVDEDFIGTLAEYYGAVHDCPPGGFFLDGMHVCKRHLILQGTKANPDAAENFDRWRLAGIDGKPRPGNRSAPSIVHCIDTGIVLWVPRENRKPRRLTFFQLCQVLADHRRDLDEVAV